MDVIYCKRKAGPVRDLCVKRNETLREIGGFQLVDKVIDKLAQAVVKDADFVISSPSAYKGTTGLERAK
ncbi:MAG: hypothetical protein IKL24_02425, partial [Clostridia bacterium]|nr:hypothetical protein [Clostridia bacterium]